jgi:hypothetical protein
MVITSAKSPQTASANVCSGTIVTAMMGFSIEAPDEELAAAPDAPDDEAALPDPFVPQPASPARLKTSKPASTICFSFFIVIHLYTIVVANDSHLQLRLYWHDRCMSTVI